MWIARLQMDGEVKGKQMTVERTDSMGKGENDETKCPIGERRRTNVL